MPRAGQAAERLVALAESAPVDRKNQALLMRAGEVPGGPVHSAGFPESGGPVCQSRQAGDHAADKLVRVSLSRTAGVPTSGRSGAKRSS